MSNDKPSQRLLVLDDDQAITAIICTVAGGIGFETRAAHRAVAFFEILEQWRPSHLIVDLVMPDRDGVEVVLELAELKFDGQIILISGLGGRSLEVVGRTTSECGLNLAGVLSKPFSPSDLRSLLTQSPAATP